MVVLWVELKHMYSCKSCSLENGQSHANMRQFLWDQAHLTSKLALTLINYLRAVLSFLLRRQMEYWEYPTLNTPRAFSFCLFWGFLHCWQAKGPETLTLQDQCFDLWKNSLAVAKLLMWWLVKTTVRVKIFRRLFTSYMKMLSNMSIILKSLTSRWQLMYLPFHKQRNSFQH